MKKQTGFQKFVAVVALLVMVSMVVMTFAVGLF